MSLLQTFLDDLHNRYRTLDYGRVASYIPELAKANPNWFGVSVAAIDGQVFEGGGVQQKFTTNLFPRYSSMAWPLKIM